MARNGRYVDIVTYFASFIFDCNVVVSVIVLFCENLLIIIFLFGIFLFICFCINVFKYLIDALISFLSFTMERLFNAFKLNYVVMCIFLFSVIGIVFVVGNIYCMCVFVGVGICFVVFVYSRSVSFNLCNRIIVAFASFFCGLMMIGVGYDVIVCVLFIEFEFVCVCVVLSCFLFLMLCCVLY